jgi:hypothetical protein
MSAADMGGERTIGIRHFACHAFVMNTFFAFAVGGVLLFIVGRSTFKIWSLGSAEMTASDRRVAVWAIAAVLVAFVATVVIMQYWRG